MNTQSQHPQQPSRSPAEDSGQLMTLRRAPSLLAFGITGALAGVLLAAALSLTPWPEGLLSGGEPVDRYTQEYSTFSVFGVLAVALSAGGAALALALALLIDRRSLRRSETVRAIPGDDPADTL